MGDDAIITDNTPPTTTGTSMNEVTSSKKKRRRGPSSRKQRKSSPTVPVQHVWNNEDQKMYMELIAAAPVRWSGVHICMPDQSMYHLVKGILLTLMEKKHRSMTRVHMGSQLEAIYALADFGINANDIPLSYTGTIKTKNIIAFTKTRTSIDTYRKLRCKQHQHPQPPQQHFPGTNDRSSMKEETAYVLEEPPGVECPELNAVVFGLKLANVYPGNVAFRQFIRIKLATYDPNKNNNSSVSNHDNAGVSHNTSSSSANDSSKTSTTTQQQQLQLLNMRYPQPDTSTSNKGSRSLFLDGIIEELTTIRKSKFYLYDKDNCWYRHIVDSSELRKRIAQFVRDEKKRMKASGMAALLSTHTRGGHNSSRGIVREASGRSQLSTRSVEGLSVLSDPASPIIKNDSNDDDESNIMDIESGASMMGVDPKRFKKDDGDCRDGTRNDNGSSWFGRGGGCV